MPSRRAILAAAVASAAAFSARASPPPPAGPADKWLIPFTPGGGCDVTARLIAEQLAVKLGHPVIAENRPGASGRVAAIAVARGPADGQTLLVGSASLAGSAAVMGPRLGFDLLEDFEFIGGIGRIDLMLAVPAALPANDLRELLNLMRSQPETVQYGSPGVGSMAHLGAERFKLATRTPASHIPYRGESAALSDLISGNLTFQFCSPHICAPRVADGKLKALAIAARERSPLAPAVPTLAQAGIAGIELGTWWYLAAPRGTPAPRLARLSTALHQVLADERFSRRLMAMGVRPLPGLTAAAVKAELAGEMQRWRPVAQAAGITDA